MGLVKAYNGDKPYIFVSYSHKDTDIILQMVSQMQCDGYRGGMTKVSNLALTGMTILLLR